MISIPEKQGRQGTGSKPARSGRTMVPTQTCAADPATAPRASLEAGKNHVRKNKGQPSPTQRAQAGLVTMQGGTGSEPEEDQEKAGKVTRRAPQWVTGAAAMLVHTRPSQTACVRGPTISASANLVWAVLISSKKLKTSSFL